MEVRREEEVSRPLAGDLGSNQTITAILSLNEAWLYTLDECVSTMPLRQLILPLMRACFFLGATYAVALLQKGHGDQVAADIAGFLIEQPRSRSPMR